MSSTAEKVLLALNTYELKSDGQNRYRCNSPLRPGSNSHSFTLTIDDAEHGAYFDHVSGENGSLYDLAKRLNIVLSERTLIATTKRSYTGLEDYALAHGLPAQTLRAAGWKEITKDGRLALEFQTRSGSRWRFLDGQKPTYKSPPGYQRCWYGLNAPLFRRIADGHALVICNGEVSTVTGQHYGMAVLSVAGGGEHEIPSELLDELITALADKRPKIIIAMDCDPTGRRAAHAINRQLKARGLDAVAVDLGLGTGGDLADFCMLHGDGSYQVLPRLSALTQPLGSDNPHPHWRIIPARDLAGLPKVAWLIDREIPERGLTTIYGPSGAGKSFLALDYALQIAQAKPVIYVAAEGESGYLVRVSAWTAHHKLNEGHLRFCLGSPNVMDEQDFGLFLGEIAAIAPVMVVVDTLAMAMIGGDENSARDMGRVIQACLDLKREVECAVVLVHHTNKAGTVERGSGALRGASDTMIKVIADDDLIIIESSKTKDAEPFATRYMKLLPVATIYGESRVLIDAGRIEQTASDPLTRNQRKVLEAMALEVFAESANISDISEITDIGRGSVQKIMSRLLRLGYVRQLSKGDSYCISDIGRSSAKVTPDSLTPLTPSKSQTEGVGAAPSDKKRESMESWSQPPLNGDLDWSQDRSHWSHLNYAEGL